MQSELTNNENNSELPLTEPHFDDEATVLSARPVVPLDEVQNDERSNRSSLARGWILAATVIVAMLVGVAGSTIYFSRVKPAVVSFPETDSIASGVDALSTEPVRENPQAPQIRNTVSEETAANENEVDSGDSEVDRNVPTRAAEKPKARRVDVITFPSTREERKAARRLAKQQQKELERETRNRKSRDDLTRIREIFEGPQKP